MLTMKTDKFLDQRVGERIKSISGISITPNGVCQLINISEKGVSFKCVDGPDISSEWFMDIYDVRGQCIERLKVKKVWEKQLKIPWTTSFFSVEVGGIFKKLSASQKAKINTYLQDLSKGRGISFMRSHQLI
jgi:hypothetical protein